MRKHFLLLLLAAVLTHWTSAQSSFVAAKWTPDQKVVLDGLPVADQTIQLDIPARISQHNQNLNTTCEKVSNQISTWKISENGSSFMITLNRNSNPQWKQAEWEMYINRILNVYFPNK
jgi:hypothetical protein